MTQNNLLTYVQTLKGKHSKIKVVDCLVQEESLDENGTTVTRYCADYQFSDGVILRYETEQDEIEQDDYVCQECWISYKVMYSPEGLNIRPGYKSFINQCQEDFWIKINQVQSNEDMRTDYLSRHFHSEV
ncbi:hypothetical protein [Vibrio quintilis]|uniref:Uncharacterized protein n=1 Tax=Vibrio quintilis TaxID=1117707 RepID=A0A1M7YRY1_9VIBR|nr:hypothetical protein [Vibrio quintilis]SHO55372.1 hypothetical protein VQ7734_01099 [Vibrio quintilis]